MNVCAHWDCKTVIADNMFLCIKHWWIYDAGLINQCPKCRRFKGAQYELCPNCFHEKQVEKWKPKRAILSKIKKYELEYSQKWRNYNKNEGPFYVYILKLDDNTFYPGQTDNLRARLLEHKGKGTKSTAGHKFKLQYFEILPTRRKALARETELKRLCNNNERAILTMIIGFQDNIGELDFT